MGSRETSEAVQYRPNTPLTTTVLVLYMGVTAAFDFLIFATLHSHRVGPVGLAAGAADFMATFIPAIDGTTDFLQRRGLPNQIGPYRALIAINWLLFILFVPAVTASLAVEIRKNEEKFLLWIETRYPVVLARRRGGVVDGLVQKALNDPLGKTRIFVAFLFVGLLFALYSDFLFTAASTSYFPGYRFLGIWCGWVCAFGTWMFLAQLSLISFYRRHLGKTKP